MPQNGSNQFAWELACHQGTVPSAVDMYSRATSDLQQVGFDGCCFMGCGGAIFCLYTGFPDDGLHKTVLFRATCIAFFVCYAVTYKNGRQSDSFNTLKGRGAARYGLWFNSIAFALCASWWKWGNVCLLLLFVQNVCFQITNVYFVLAGMGLAHHIAVSTVLAFMGLFAGMYQLDLFESAADYDAYYSYKAQEATDATLRRLREREWAEENWAAIMISMVSLLILGSAAIAAIRYFRLRQNSTHVGGMSSLVPPPTMVGNGVDHRIRLTAVPSAVPLTAAPVQNPGSSPSTEATDAFSSRPTEASTLVQKLGRTQGSRRKLQQHSWDALHQLEVIPKHHPSIEAEMLAGLAEYETCIRRVCKMQSELSSFPSCLSSAAPALLPQATMRNGSGAVVNTLFDDTRSIASDDSQISYHSYMSILETTARLGGGAWSTMSACVARHGMNEGVGSFMQQMFRRYIRNDNSLNGFRALIFCSKRLLEVVEERRSELARVPAESESAESESLEEALPNQNSERLHWALVYVSSSSGFQALPEEVKNAIASFLPAMCRRSAWRSAVDPWTRHMFWSNSPARLMALQE